MTLYSFNYIHSVPTDEEVPFGFSIPVCAGLSIEEVQAEIREILEEFFPEAKVPPDEISYAVHAAAPSWTGLDEDETWHALFEVKPCL